MIVRIRGLKIVKAKGQHYYYDRATMTRIASMNEAGEVVYPEPSDPAFMVALAEIRRGSTKPAAVPGTWGAIVTAYRAAPKFTQLAPRTKKEYLRVFDHVARLNARPFDQWSPPFVNKLTDRMATRDYRFARLIRQVISLVANWAISRGFTKANPAEQADTPQRPKDKEHQNRPWTAHELAVVYEKANAGLKAGIALGMYGVMREGDVIRFARTAYDGSRITFRQGKTGEQVTITAPRQLRQALDGAPRTDSTTIVTNAHGRPFTENSFRSAFFKLIRKLQEKREVGQHLTFHGLRHTAPTLLAEAGVDPLDIQALLGHQSMAATMIYIRSARRKLGAARAARKLERIMS